MDKMKSPLKVKDYIGGKKSREKQDPRTQQLIAISKQYYLLIQHVFFDIYQRDFSN